MNTNKKDSLYPIRLQSYLAKCGVCSRRKAEDFIRNGLVTVNNKIILNPAEKVTENDAVYCNNQYIEPMDHIYIALNKPKGYVCTNSDPHEELFARDLIAIPEQKSLFHVGRLDKDSTGLIFYTNDGDFANTISHPSFGVEKEYIVRTKEKLDKKDLLSAIKGIQIQKTLYKIERYKIINSKTASMTLLEGKNREIRKIMEHLGYKILSLTRIRIGSVELATLKIGYFRFLKKKEMSQLISKVNKK
ncbi:MAG: rRNA pseudouridine synthase [Spirochaetia bacterium]|nr:rRNA pseudouridine synthase [Spirochaetia bacterium]